MRSAKIIVTGIVQGVGFRPAVYRLAVKLNLKGYVRNIGGSEVEIWVEGSEDGIREFINQMLSRMPPPARIESLHVEFSSLRGYKTFKILPSAKGRIYRSMIPPDIAVCDECLAEILNSHDRRYRYPFNSCAWCGPRFSMMYATPYDRENTAMKDFPLCNGCVSEYRDPNNERRFHAQGISCPRCGPKLELRDRSWELVDVKDPLREAAKLINEGNIVAVKGLGGYHIAALATDDDVVIKLRRRKNRPSKPFAVMVLDIDVASKVVELSDSAVKLLLSMERPIVLLPKKKDSPISKYVSPGLNTEGIFLPYTPLHYLLIADIRDRMAIMTSGNARDLPMCIDEYCARNVLLKFVDYVLVHNREIVNRVDDSVVRFTAGEPVLLRRGRGYAPKWIRLNKALSKPAIAFGADIHNVGAVAFDDKVVLTQYIGELSNKDVAEDLLKYINFFVGVYGIPLKNSVVIVDKHPKYLSRALGMEFAERYGLDLLEVQHHYAHILATLADRKLGEGKYIGLALDGVGYGDDGNIWGCEVLLVGNSLKYKRLAHMKYVRSTGSDRDVIYPARMLISFLSEFMDAGEMREVFNKLGLMGSLPLGEAEFNAVITRLSAGAPLVKISSIGRLLDSISVLLGVCHVRTYEGEPAIRLESAASGGKYVFDDELPKKMVTHGESTYELDPTPLLKELVDIMLNEKSRRPCTKDLAYSSLKALAKALTAILRSSMKGRRVEPYVLLGGGAVVNDIITRTLKEELLNDDIYVLLPKEVPPNDGGIALGQVTSLLLGDGI
ncbi:MAG: carbamoyltransferase HypF [Desulfurococcales archaeon]|nr:carbamoyltransferase HypF [Desulfurococcales archaeon]